LRSARFCPASRRSVAVVRHGHGPTFPFPYCIGPWPSRTIGRAIRPAPSPALRRAARTVPHAALNNLPECGSPPHRRSLCGRAASRSSRRPALRPAGSCVCSRPILRPHHSLPLSHGAEVLAHCIRVHKASAITGVAASRTVIPPCCAVQSTGVRFAAPPAIALWLPCVPQECPQLSSTSKPPIGPNNCAAPRSQVPAHLGNSRVGAKIPLRPRRPAP
jgi:hypothetical protein